MLTQFSFTKESNQQACYSDTFLIGQKSLFYQSVKRRKACFIVCRQHDYLYHKANEEACKAVCYTVIKHSGHFRTVENCKKHKPQAIVFYNSSVFLNAPLVLSRCNTRLMLLCLLNKQCTALFLTFVIFCYFAMGRESVWIWDCFVCNFWRFPKARQIFLTISFYLSYFLHWAIP